LAESYLENLTHRFYSVKTLLELRSISSARDRLLHYLTQRLSSGQSTITLDKPFRAIASELAMTPEALSRLLSRLQIEGIMTRKRRTITFSQDWLNDFIDY
jgi:CRP-like cAMP-binding protein